MNKATKPERKVVQVKPSNKGAVAPKGFKWIFTRFRRVKNSERLLDARDYGYSVWAFLVRA